MRYRSWLLVPGDSERKLGKALATGADVVVVDLDAGIAPEARGMARTMAGEWLRAHRRQVLEAAPMARWVRISPLDSRQWRADLEAVMPGAPEGIILPGAEGPQTLRDLAAELYEFEMANQIATNTTRIPPIAGTTARSALTIAAYIDAGSPRFAGLSWSADGLADAINATRQREPRGGWSDPFRFVRAQALLVAHACAVMAIEALHHDAADLKGLKLAARAARADGFTGMFAEHPAQVAEINAAFTPSEAELEQARQIVAAFEAGGESEAAGFDRRRVDLPQLKLARQILGASEPRPAELTPMRVMRPA
jgi:citrate lyase subunit beta / citryl-CoA lyase